MAFAVETLGLCRNFADLRAVDHLNLSVEEGEMFGIVGPDGAGKTTTIKMLCGILAPSEGTAKILGSDIITETEKVKRNIGYLSQRFSLYGDLTVDENVEFFAEINGVFDYKRRKEELLEFTRLTPFRARLADRLSGGMKQKLALACTLIHTPKLLFLDEPTTGVDPVSRRDFWKILQSLQMTGITIVMTTPYLDEAERCSRVCLLNQGNALRTDTPPNLKRQMEGRVLEIVCEKVRAASAVVKGLNIVEEVQTFGDRLNIMIGADDAVPTAIENALTNAGITLLSTRIVTPSLENVFISLLTHAPEEEEAPA
jgi:ABC-2 type transport system ATP-binding protein